MMVLCSNHSSRAFHAFAQKHPGKVGWIIGPTWFKSPPEYLPFALDNDAFGAWNNHTEWSYTRWVTFLNRVRSTQRIPMWVLVPDVVADRQGTLNAWNRFSPVAACYGWPLAFAVQDGMTVRDVPRKAHTVFIGGTTSWKWRTLPMWTKNFERVHVGRVSTRERLEIAEHNGAVSVDGTGFFRESFHGRRARCLVDFIEGHRNRTPFFKFLQAH